MIRIFKKMSRQIGPTSGIPVFADGSRPGPSRMTVYDYDASNCLVTEVSSLDACLGFKDKPTVTWINIDGTADVALLEKLDTAFGVHPLVLEDIVTLDQRPKFEDYGTYLFIVVKMLTRDPQSADIIAEQVSLLVGSNYVISFQEREGDVFNEIRTRIRTNKGRIRKMGADYLAYCLLDAIADNCFRVLEWFGEQIEDLEEKLIEEEIAPETTVDVHRLKREVILFRKQIWPLREVIGGMQRSGSKIIKRSTDVFLRDLYDHMIQIIDTNESYRDILSGMHDVYLSILSNRMNEVMKTLTIFAAIFIPLTFIAGIYGMNFEYMPALRWKYGFFVLMGIMAAIGITMLAYFKRKNWL